MAMIERVGSKTHRTKHSNRREGEEEEEEKKKKQQKEECCEKVAVEE